MGTNALTVASPGQDIPANHHNELVQALLQNLVPRNASRTAEDLAGALGTSALRWLRAYVETYHIGTAANNLTIYEGNPGEIFIDRGGAVDTIRLRTGFLEFTAGSSMLMNIGATTLTYLPAEMVTPNNYIRVDGLQTRQSKMGLSHGDGSVPGASLALLAPAIVLNGAKAGKYFLVEITFHNYSWSGSGSGTPDFVMRLNGTIVKAWNDELPGSYTTSTKSFMYKHAVPGDNNYTIEFLGQEFSTYNATFRVEEV